MRFEQRQVPSANGIELMSLMNTPRFYELGPVRMADLRKQAEAAEAMGNIAGARILYAEIEVISARWEATLERYKPEPREYTFSGKPAAKIDTQGR